MENTLQRGIAEIMRDEMVMRDKILAILREEPKTIPEIAESLGCPSSEVVYWIMAMWRYGQVEEDAAKPDANGYFRYKGKSE